MKPRISMVTLGVSDLQKSIAFYQRGLGFPKMESPPDVAFFTLNGSWLGLYARDSLAQDAMDLPTITADEIDRMYKIAYREFFFRPSYLWRRLWKMRSLSDIRMNLQALRSIMFAKATTRPKTKRGVILKEATAEIASTIGSAQPPKPTPAVSTVERQPSSQSIMEEPT